MPLEPGGARARLRELLLEPEHVLDAREVEPELRRQPLDQAQALEIGIRVEAGVARRPLRTHESLRLVHAERLLVHADEVGGDRDRVARAIGHQPVNASSRGSSRDTFWSSSRASRSFFVSFFGTVTFRRASRSPRPPPFSFGAPRPLTFSNLPSCEPAGTLSEILPSGVGTSTVAPSAASGYVTGTSTTRSEPRRSYSGDVATRVTTHRSPGG